MTAAPQDLLAHLADMRVEALFVLKDLHPHLADPVVERRFRDVAAAFGRTHATLVLVGAGIDVPDAVESDAVRVPLALPGRDETRPR